MKKILFICGSPGKYKSSSFYVAKYVAQFLEHRYEFFDIARTTRPDNFRAKDSLFLKAIDKIEKADLIVWTFGVYVFFVPLNMQVFFQNLLFHGYRFPGKFACSIATNMKVKDDYALNKTKIISKMAGFRYLGDISVEGNPFYKYSDNKNVEENCQILAGRINRALTINGSVLRNVRSRYAEIRKKNHLLIIAGEPMSGGSSTTKMIVDCITKSTDSEIETIELSKYNIQPCKGCYGCFFDTNSTCIYKDDYIVARRKIDKADGIILVGYKSFNMIDYYMKGFLERSYILCRRPSLADKYGFTITIHDTNPMAGEDAYLKDAVSTWGVNCVADVDINDGSNLDFIQDLQLAVADLDIAIKEQWNIDKRFFIYGKTLVQDKNIREQTLFIKEDRKFCKRANTVGVIFHNIKSFLLMVGLHNEKIRRKFFRFKAKNAVRMRQRKIEKLLDGH